MKTRHIFLRIVAGLYLVSFLSSAFAEDQVFLQLQPAGSEAEVRLQSHFALPVASMYPEYTIQRSTDLQTWTNVAVPIQGSIGVSDETLRALVPAVGSHGFFRVAATVKLNPSEGDLGDAIYGYATEFSRQIQCLGQLTLEDFVQLYTLTNQYLPQITFDPTTAEYWDLFNAHASFQLNAAELAMFQTNGFVVSQRLERQSFADIFYGIYSADLPVFITTDSILHAWHRSFVTMLEELEETSLSPQLGEILQAMSAQVPALWANTSSTAMRNGVLDADYFLAVAQSMLTGIPHAGSLGQSGRVASTLTLIDQGEFAGLDLYGTNRLIDFSQFKVRGHYETSATLSNYFRAMMWCSRADFRFAGDATGLSTNNSANSLRELSGAVALHFLLQNSGQFSNWLEFNKVIEMFVGEPDSLNFAQLSGLLDQANITSPADLSDQLDLETLQTQLMVGEVGVQQILSDWYWSPFGSRQVKLPRSFTFMGQRFVVDSWALGKCTFDDILWFGPGARTVSGKVLRRVPSALDVAFGVLGNDQIVPDIAARIAHNDLTYDDGRIFWRDGLPFQHNLAAVRNVIDGQNESGWTNTVYGHWLACLRELSAPTAGPEFPQAMRTRAWAMKTLNAQLASWTQLRHDTVLYAKQSYTPPILCSYPDGYVEPRPEFWERVRQMALGTKALLSRLPSTGTVQLVVSAIEPGWPEETNEVSVATLYANRLALMDHYAGTMATLRDISQRELNRQPLTTNQTSFLKSLMESEFDPYYGLRTYGGWYPALFYHNARYNARVNFGVVEDPSEFWDALVTDVHTDLPDEIVADPGSILHEGVGNVQLLVTAVDCGPGDLAVYAGPVLSHYEFELGPTTRRTDSEWKNEVLIGSLPPQPEWTECYLVPRP